MNANTEHNSTHTPGPWSREIDDKWFSIWGNHADLIARTPRLTDGGLPYLAGEADARLIAAAPNLLEAVKNAAGMLDTPVGRRKHAGDEFYSAVVESLRNAIVLAVQS